MYQINPRSIRWKVFEREYQRDSIHFFIANYRLDNKIKINQTLASPSLMV